MIIKKLKLKNFQKHSNLTLELNEGVNIIHGSSDVGKSAVRRAIEWCLFCENISGIQKEGTNKTSVCIVFDKGIEIERVKSSSINRYILRVEEEEKVFDAIGKSMPQEIKDILNINTVEVDGNTINVNISRQLDAPFLIGKEYSASGRMKLFNKITGTELVDKGIKKLSKDTRKIDQDIKHTDMQIEDQTDKLHSLTKEYAHIDKKYELASRKLGKIKKLEQKWNTLAHIQEDIAHTRLRRQESEDLAKRLEVPDTKSLRKKIELRTILNRLQDTNLSLENEKTDIGHEISKITLPTSNMDILKGKIKRLDTLKSLSDVIYDKDNTLYMIQAIDEDMDNNKDEKKQLMGKIDICPVCMKKL